jgi:phosphocarrier protein HPr
MQHSRDVTIQNKYGLHARPAAEFVKLANQFSAEVWVAKEEIEVSGKSIMGVMMLAAEFGSTIQIRAAGADSEAALEALSSLIASKFGEE